MGTGRALVKAIVSLKNTLKHDEADGESAANLPRCSSSGWTAVPPGGCVAACLHVQERLLCNLGQQPPDNEAEFPYVRSPQRMYGTRSREALGGRIIQTRHSSASQRSQIHS